MVFYWGARWLIFGRVHVLFFKIFIKLLFIYSWETQKERQRHRQREKQAPCREPDMGPDPGTPGSCPGPKAGAKPLSHPGIPDLKFFYLSQILASLSRRMENRIKINPLEH